MNQWLDVLFRFYAQGSESPDISLESPNICSEICPEISELAAKTLKIANTTVFHGNLMKLEILVLDVL
jgi:hypothetical protein